MADSKIVRLFGCMWLVTTWAAFAFDWDTGTPLVCSVVCFSASAILGNIESQKAPPPVEDK